MSRPVQGGASIPVHITGSDGDAGDDTTQPVSGTITANQGTPAATSNAWPTSARARDVAAADIHAPAAGNAAVITLDAPGAGLRHVISGIAFSYGTTPTGGALSITENGVTVFVIQVPAAGWGVIPFNPPKRFGANLAVVITLASGGGAVVARLSLLGHWTE